MVWGVSIRDIAIGVALFFAGVIVSSAVVVALLVSIRPDHFIIHPREQYRSIQSGPRRVAYIVGRNLLGVALIVVGLLLSLPGVPGQGLLTVLVGVILLDIPGKRKLERRLLARKNISSNINALRRRMGRKPLILSPPESTDATRRHHQNDSPLP